MKNEAGPAPFPWAPRGIFGSALATLLADEAREHWRATRFYRLLGRMLFAAEYKRRQAPPGVKITSRNFGRDRRYPLTNAFRES